MEAYLSDAFIHLVSTNEKFLEKYKNIDKPFEGKDLVKHLEERSFHNPKEFRKLYRKTFNLRTFPEISEIIPLVEKRHDIVHRNGMEKKHKSLQYLYRGIETSKPDVEKAVLQVNKFVNNLTEILSKL